jgi:hypothetical protein
MLCVITIILVARSPSCLQTLGIAAAVHDQAFRLLWRQVPLLWVVILLALDVERR